MRRMGWRAAVVGVFGGVLCLPGTFAQVPADGSAQASPQPGGGQGRRGQWAGMDRAMGEVTAVAGGTLTVKTGEGGTLQVVTTDNTRVMKDRGPVKVGDLHVGDGLVAMGILDAPNKTLHAAVVMAEDAAQVKAMRDNLGKTYITGRVTAVDLDNAKMTVMRADHQAQTIGFDETTSFKRAVRGNGGNGGPGGNGSGGEGAGEPGRGPGGGFGGGGNGGMGMGAAALNGGIDRAFSNGESITLADIKVGDYVAGTGSVKGGTFVPVHLVDTPPGQRRPRNGAGAPGAGSQQPGSGMVSGPGL